MPRARLKHPNVIEAAAALADAKGIEAVTLSALADQLGIRTPSLYNHVASLADLRLRLTVVALTELYCAVEAEIGQREGAEAFQAMCRAYRNWAQSRPGLYACVVPTALVEDEDIRRAGERLLSITLQTLKSLGVADDVAIHAARYFRSTLHGFVTLEQAGGFGIDRDPDESFDWTVKSLLSGLVTR